MSFYKSKLMSVLLFISSFIMMILQFVAASKGFTSSSNTTMFGIMVTASVILFVAAIIVTISSESTIGYGLLFLSVFLALVACTFPSASGASTLELLIVVFLPIVLLSTSFIAVRGGGNFKRVMAITIGILFIVIYLYSMATAIYQLQQTTKQLYTVNSYGGYALTSTSDAAKTYRLNIAYSVFAILYYICVLVTGIVCFKGSESD